MSQIILTVNDELASQMFAYTAKYQISFDEMTERLWVDFLQNHLENELSINSEQQQILEQRYLAVKNGHADLIEHDDMMGYLKNSLTKAINLKT
ncbi:hypothetical protein [Moraxella sp. ZY210820]|uniref:hypothetical protein n=1 Tax=unclassified Moraxella TaxID=2685852 RepID=UPI0027313D25|nr:hypothetical protein [Moraxella sp. ZY210820]WLF83090.1 hypothetical protein LU301_07375 [Moraxella sp. ZY210820]